MEAPTLSAVFPSLQFDMLDDIDLALPDEDHETHYYSYPIDENTFGQYVDQLEAGAIQAAPLQGFAGNGMGEVANGFIIPDQSAYSQPGAGQEPQFVAQPMAVEAGNGSLMARGQVGHVVTSGFPTGGMTGAEPNPLERPSAGSTASGVWGERNSGTGGEAGYNMEADDEVGGNTGNQDHLGLRNSSRTKRNARQQQQNKAAQQRYRERRKQRFHEMEAALTAVHEQMQAMGSVQSENAALQGRAAQLEAQLREKEQEIVRLRIALEATNIKAEDDTEDIVSPLELGHNIEKAQEKNKEQEEAQLQEKFAERHAALSAFVQQHGLRNADPTGADLPEETSRKLQEMLSLGCSTFQRAMRANGLKVVELMAKRPDVATRVSCHVIRARWQHILSVLRLTSEQEEKIMDLRKTELGLLRKVYEQRQALNLQAMQMMLPPQDAYAEDEQGNMRSPAERKIQCMASNGYSACAHHSLSLNKVLDAIKRNLRQEQHVICDMNFNIMQRIFSPVQTALLLVEVYPNHCDMLALANCLAASLNREDSIDSGKSCSGHSESCHGPESPI
eukprot:jgi/Botrbrau1/11465/Bobra.27_4s0006.1